MKASKILALLLAALMCLALVSCKKTPTEPAPAPEGGDGEGTAAVQTLNLGFIGPLTGDAALYGSSAANGAQIAVNEINSDPNAALKINFFPMDDQHDAEVAVNAYGSLLDQKVQAIVGCVTTTPCNAVAAEAFVDRMFMLTPSASSPSVLEGRDNVYQLCFSDPNQGTASAQYIGENQLAKKVAVIYNNADAYSTGIFQNFEAAAPDYGLELVSVTTFTGDTANDFSVQLADAKDKGAELIFLPIYYTPAAMILKQAKTMDLNVKFFGCDGLDGLLDQENFDVSLAEGVMLLTPFAADAQDEETVSFVTKYKEAYNGETPSQFAADGYDCVYAIYDAIMQAGIDVTDMSHEDLCQIMIDTFSSEQFAVNGLTGSGMTWDKSGEVSKEPKAVVIKDGVYVGM